MKMPTKAIIPAAGLGTRFLPQTKAMPKEMLPIIDKPVIQMVVEELTEAGVTDIIIVTGPQKRAIEDHFDRDEGLEQALRNKGKEQEAEDVEHIAERANFVYLRQKRQSHEPLGNALPVRNAMHLLADEPFFVVFPDDFFLCDGPSSIQQILDVYKETGKSVIQTMHVKGPDIERYGIVQLDEEVKDGIVKVKGLVEKPDHESAPSNIASVGGYLLTPDILPIIKSLKAGNGGEIGLSDAVSILAQQDNVYGKIIEGTYHDAGNKARYLEAVVDATLRHPELQTEFRAYLECRLNGA